MSLTTLNENKIFLGIPLGDTSQDARIELFRLSVEQQVINFCDTAFEPTLVTHELHDGVISDVILPKNAPIISIQGLYFYCDAAGNGGSLMEQGSAYYINENAITLRDMFSPRGRGVMRIDYTYGYGAVPADVKMSVYQSVKAELSRNKRNTEDVASRSKMNESESYNAAWDKKTGLPSQIISKLQPYRVYEFPNVSMAQRNR